MITPCRQYVEADSLRMKDRSLRELRYALEGSGETLASGPAVEQTWNINFPERLLQGSNWPIFCVPESGA